MRIGKGAGNSVTYGASTVMARATN